MITALLVVELVVDCLEPISKVFKLEVVVLVVSQAEVVAPLVKVKVKVLADPLIF